MPIWLVTPETVKQRVEEIRDCVHSGFAHWNERAHGMEDDLMRDVLVAIAFGPCDDPVGCARTAFETNKIVFSRQCS